MDNTISTSNLDFAAYLDVKGFKLVDTEISSRGICTWVYEENVSDEDPWITFLKKDEVPAVLFAEALRRAKKSAFEKKSYDDVIIKRRR